MSALKNYNNFCLANKNFSISVVLFLLIFCAFDVYAAEALNNASNTIGISDYLKAILGLAFVIGLFLLSTFLFRRYGSGPMLGRGQLKIIDGLHIGNRERLMLVDIKGKQILLAVTPGKITKLDTLDKVVSTQEEHVSAEAVLSEQASVQAS